MSYQRQKQTHEKLHREDEQESWLVRKTTSASRKDKQGREHCTITCELVFGRRLYTDGRTTILGDPYHVLTGPTARKSMDEYAARLNREKTPPSELKRCCADGSRIPKDGGKGQMMFSEYLGTPRLE